MRVAAAALGLAGSATYGYVWADPDASGWSEGWEGISVMVALGGLWVAAAAGAIVALKRPVVATPLLAIPGVVGFAYYLWPAGLAMLCAAALCLLTVLARRSSSGGQP